MLRRLEEVLKGLADLAEKWGAPSLLASIRRARAQGGPEQAVDESAGGHARKGFYTRGPRVIDSVPTNARQITAMLAGRGESQEALHVQARESDRMQSAMGKFSDAVARFVGLANKPAGATSVAQETAGMTIAQRYQRLKEQGKLVRLREVASRYPVGTDLTRRMQVEESETDEQRDREAHPEYGSKRNRPFSLGGLAWNAAKSSLGKTYQIGNRLGSSVARAVGASPALADAVGGATGTLSVTAGIVGSLGFAAVKAVRALDSFATATVESSRALAPYHGAFGMAFAQLDFQQMHLQVRMSQQTHNTFVPLVESIRRMRDELQPLRGDFKNVQNKLAGSIAEHVSAVARLANWLSTTTGIRRSLTDDDFFDGGVVGNIDELERRKRVFLGLQADDSKKRQGQLAGHPAQWVMRGFADRAGLEIPKRSEPMNRRVGE